MKRKQKRPTGKTILKKLNKAGVGAFRVTRHKDGSYTAGFFIPRNIMARCMDHRQSFKLGHICAAIAARKITLLGYRVVDKGNDLDPGYKSLSFGGTTTPMVRFFLDPLPKAPIISYPPTRLIPGYRHGLMILK